MTMRFSWYGCGHMAAELGHLIYSAVTDDDGHCILSSEITFMSDRRHHDREQMPEIRTISSNMGPLPAPRQAVHHTVCTRVSNVRVITITASHRKRFPFEKSCEIKSMLYFFAFPQVSAACRRNCCAVRCVAIFWWSTHKLQYSANVWRPVTSSLHVSARHTSEVTTYGGIEIYILLLLLLLLLYTVSQKKTRKLWQAVVSISMD